MDKLYRLVYTSFKEPECNDLEVRRILEACKRNNPGKDVTGILLHSNSRFIQYLEGGKKDLEDLFKLISNDPRHTTITLRSFEPIEERIFPGWEMGFKDLSGKDIAFLTDVSARERETLEGLINGALDLDNEGLRVLQSFFRT